MKKLFPVLIILFLSFPAFTQKTSPCTSCLPDGIQFHLQTDIDSFPIKYPGCTHIEGTVLLEGASITDLTPLSVLTSVGADLDIWSCHSLTDLHGLENLTAVGGRLSISSNTSLIHLSGLENLTTIGENLYLEMHWYLRDLVALSHLNSIGGTVNINDNDSITDLTGLENLSIIPGNLEIIENHALKTLNGIQNITSVGGDLDVGGNYELLTLNPLINLSSIGGDLIIYNNNRLKTLTGLDNIDPESITDLEIQYNDSLSFCSVMSICSYLASPNGDVDIFVNTTGCNDEEEVADTCIMSGISTITPQTHFSFFPNPSEKVITLKTDLSGKITLYTSTGAEIFSREVNNDGLTIDTDFLKPGMYLLKFTTGAENFISKLIKE